MSSADDIGYPTVGGLLQFAYDAFGVLPRKHSPEDEFDEAKKKSIQHALNRLRKEEGDINTNVGWLLSTLGYLVTAHVPNPRFNLLMNEVTCDISDVYLAVLKDDGTYLNKNETIRWVINDYLIGRLAFSIHKHLLRFNVASEGLVTPTGFWYLPDFNGGKIVMPLSKAMRWIYEECGMSQTGFHSLQAEDAEEDFEMDRRLDNAQNWIKSKGMPSLSGLLTNFNASFDRLQMADRLTQVQRDSFSLALIFARVSSYVCDVVLKTYGAAYLEQVCSDFKECYVDATEEFAEFKAGTSSDVIDLGLSGLEEDEHWVVQTQLFCDAYVKNSDELSQLLSRISVERHTEFFRDMAIHPLLLACFGPFAINGVTRKLQRDENRDDVSMEFWNLLDAGLALRKNPAMTSKELGEFERQLKVSGVEHLLSWMAPWLHAIRLNWKKEYKQAFPFIEEAYTRAKYRAGGNQKAITKLFLSIAAKCEEVIAFRRGARWAHYIRLDLPWLNDGPLSNDDINSLREMMRTQWH